MTDDGAFDQVMRIAQFATFAIGIGAVLWKLGGLATKLQMTDAFQSERMAAAETGLVLRMEKVEMALEKLSTVVVTQATQNLAIVQLRDDINLLRAGKGYIDAQYPRRGPEG